MAQAPRPRRSSPSSRTAGDGASSSPARGPHPYESDPRMEALQAQFPDLTRHWLATQLELVDNL